MKKFICIALVLVIVMGILSGCCCALSERCDQCLDRDVITFTAVNRGGYTFNLCPECYGNYLEHIDLYLGF